MGHLRPHPSIQWILLDPIATQSSVPVNDGLPQPACAGGDVCRNSGHSRDSGANAAGYILLTMILIPTISMTPRLLSAFANASELRYKEDKQGERCDYVCPNKSDVVGRKVDVVWKEL